MARKEINMDIDDPRIGKVAEVISNKTCKKILGVLAEEPEMSESEIASRLGLPLNTIGYNVDKLVEAGLIEPVKGFLWSVKGKRIQKYRVANKKIVISPKVNVNKIAAGFVGALILVGVIALIISLQNSYPELPSAGDDGLKTFNNLNEIKDFVKENSESNNYYGRGIFAAEKSMAEDSAAPAAVSSGESASGGASDYSETNIQVEGVDEPDIVKNDGKYIYAVSGKKVVIVNAYPAEQMKILSEIEFDDYIRNIFVNDDKLVVFADKYEYIDTGVRCGDGFEIGIMRCGGYSKQTTLVYVYDISDRAEPELEDEVTADGSYIDARMTGDYVYVVSSKWINLNYFDLPVYGINGAVKEVSADSVHYFDSPDSNYVFNSITALNLDNGEVNSEVYLLGQSSTIYVSEDNIYLTYMKQISQKYYFEKFVDDVVMEVFPVSERNKIENIMDSDDSLSEKRDKVNEIINDYPESLEKEELSEFMKEYDAKAEEFYRNIQKETEMTVVHKIGIDELDIDYAGMGEVPGNVLNQFSMDEYDGNFRIATTTGQWGGESLNHLFVLDENLDVIGSVEDLAKGERIYSARFMGDRAYMVTFRQVDPLYVIDLSNPEKPEVLGYLKVTGYSGYLHPYDSNHLIGIGMEADESGRTQGLKVALFDVSDVANPVEVGKYEVKGMWASSEALYEHKAVLFDKSRNLLVIPVSYTEEDGTSPEGWTKYNYWQGAFVFDISLDGIDLRGEIAHEINETRDYYYNGQAYVRRALYMYNVLYTISDRKVKANDLNDLRDVKEVELPWEEWRVYYGGGIVA